MSQVGEELMATCFPNAEGRVPFKVPGSDKPAHTWYKMVGNSYRTPPLIICHGGPGAGHEALLPYADIYLQYGRGLIFYDQIGCGQSTRFPEKMGDERFWNAGLYWAELDNLINLLRLREFGYNILGHGWGGMLAGSFASMRPYGLRKLIIVSAPASGALYQQSLNSLLPQLPDDVKERLEDCEKRGDYRSEEYKAASMEFFKRFVCRVDPLPKTVMDTLHLKEDNTSHMTIQGPSQFRITGWLKYWDPGNVARHISVPTLLINGKYDKVKDAAMEPWFHQIPNVNWIKLNQSSHLGCCEERDYVVKTIGAWLQ